MFAAHHVCTRLSAIVSDTQVPKNISNIISNFAILSKYHCCELNKYSEEKIGEIDAALILIKL